MKVKVPNDKADGYLAALRWAIAQTEAGERPDDDVVNALYALHGRIEDAQSGGTSE